MTVSFCWKCVYFHVLHLFFIEHSYILPRLVLLASVALILFIQLLNFDLWWIQHQLRQGVFRSYVGLFSCVNFPEVVISCLSRNFDLAFVFVDRLRVSDASVSVGARNVSITMNRSNRSYPMDFTKGWFYQLDGMFMFEAFFFFCIQGFFFYKSVFSLIIRWANKFHKKH